MCVCVRERECVCVCVRERERERDRARVHTQPWPRGAADRHAGPTYIALAVPYEVERFSHIWPQKTMKYFQKMTA